MTNKIIEAATACGVWVPMGNDKQKDVSALARLYALARAEALEDAAKACRPFGKTGAVVAAAIKALKEQQHG